MDRLAPGLRLEAITLPRQDIMRIWRTLRQVDHAFIQGIIGDMVMFTETPVDWIFLRTTIEFWDPEHAVFNFHGTELAPTIEEYTTLIQRPTPTTQGIFVPNLFATIRRIDIAATVPGHLDSSSCTYPALEAESSTQAAMRAELRAIREERDRLRCELVDSRAEVADYRELQTELTRARARVAHLEREMALLSARLDRVRRLRMAEGDRVDIFEEVNPPVPTHSQPPPAHAPSPPTPAGILPAYSGAPPTPAGILPAYSGAPPTHLPPPTSSGAPLPTASLTASASDDQARITALEGTINQMATNMAELLALLRGPNCASSSSTPPPGQGPTVDPTPWVPPTQAPENMDTLAPPTLHTSMAHPFTSPFPPPPAPTAVPLPSTCIPHFGS
ncbi:hypothetical protein CRG98_023834, partial [Punica granatum]